MPTARLALLDLVDPRVEVITVAKPSTILTDQQCDAVQAVQDWYICRGSHNPAQRPFRLFGPAGTGKTTIVKHIASALGLSNVVFGAYTGKAAHVLRSKGVPASTIHSAVYALDGRWDLKKRRAAIQTQMWAVDRSTNEKHWQELDDELREIELKLRRPAFMLDRMSPWGDADLIVLDEVSMVNERMARDIESFGVPVLVLGDPAQLPPIEGGGYYTNAAPDFELTEVHRQALESPVLKLATDVRVGRGWADARVPVSLAEAMAADQVLVWKNSTRWNLITAMRKALGRPAGVPVPGDRVMCLVNNKDLGILNGQQYEVLEVKDGDLFLRDEDGNENWFGARMDAFRGLEQEQAQKQAGAWQGDSGLFTFANAITVHKAQGSEWPHVYIVDQTSQMTRSTPAEKRAWSYTAVSRASERVTIAVR